MAMDSQSIIIFDFGSSHTKVGTFGDLSPYVSVESIIGADSRHNVTTATNNIMIGKKCREAKTVRSASILGCGAFIM
ncbi:hypothetical protein I4U23_009666 [Adineta vaga]|nr:hypothetical protein I4U23_009666 [Adineta vaga]